LPFELLTKMKRYRVHKSRVPQHSTFFLLGIMGNRERKRMALERMGF
jgi:hypothetical protein